MAPKDAQSHAHIWDDSALVDSWNDALKEYQKYHSVIAQGEDVEKVLNEAEEPTQSRDEQIEYLDEEHNDEPLVNESIAKQELPGETEDHEANTAANHVEARAQLSLPAEQASNGLPTLSQPLIGQVHDEGLKNLLMSWYYAGYYTGLHEGRQEVKTSTSAKHEA